MAFGAGSGNDVLIKVKLDADGAIKGVELLDKKVKGAGKSAETAATGFTKAQKSIISLDSASNLAAKGFDLLARSAGSLINGLQKGAALDDISQSLNNLAKQAGSTAGVVINGLNTALDGTISKAELTRVATEGLIAGLRPDQLQIAAEAARSFGDALGGSSLQKLEQFNLALVTGNDRLLKRIGISVDAEQAERKHLLALGVTKNQIEDYRQVLTETERIEIFRNEALDQMREKTQALGKPTLDVADQIDRVNASLQNNIDKVLEAASKNATLNKAIGDLADYLETIDFTKIINGLEEMATWMGKIISLTASVARGLGAIGGAVANGATGGIQAAIFAQDEYSQALEDTFADLDAVSKGVAGFNEVSIKATEVTTKQTEAIIKQDGALAKLNARVRDRQKGVDPSVIADLTGQSGAFTGLDTSVLDDSIADAAASAEQQMEAEMSAAMLEGLGTAFDVATQAMSGDFGRAQVQPLAASIGGSLGAALGSAFGPGGAEIGGLIGNFAGDIIGQFASSLGEDSAGTKARKAADKFFADAFDANRLSIIVGNEIKEISDLVFQGDTPFGGQSSLGGETGGFFSALPVQAQAAFTGIGVAFEEFLGVSEELSGMVGEVLANNIGGSLENLQLLVQATGVSFEELGNAIFESFYKGNLSIAEAQSALQQLQEVILPGIPGQVGAIGTAFENLNIAMASGKGGRIVLESLRDIGAEAQELGIHDIPALANSLIQNFGLSGQAVDQFFQAMKATGINTVADLVNASQEALLAFADNLRKIQEGLAPDSVAVDLSPTESPATAGGGFSGGAARSDFNQKETQQTSKQNQARKQLNQTTRQLLETSREYEEILKGINDGTIGNLDASKNINDLYGEIRTRIQEASRAEEAYNKALKAGAKGKKVDLAALAKAYEDAQKALDDFRKSNKDLSEGIKITSLEALKPFEGNLNVIGMIGKELGITFEKVAKDIVNAFKGGNLSAKEAADKLREVKDTLEGGIPGVEGDVTGAIQNVVKAGTKGGAVLLDALGDIAIEAKERFLAGLNPLKAEQFKELTASFSEARNALESALSGGPQDGESRVDFATRVRLLEDTLSGAKKALDDFGSTNPAVTLQDLRSYLGETLDPAAVEKFFQALDKEGIDTFEELQNANDETLTLLAGTLEDLKFPFQQTTDETTKLLATLNELSAGQFNAKINLQVSTTFDNSTTESIFTQFIGDTEIITPAGAGVAPAGSATGNPGKKKPGKKKPGGKKR